MHTVKPLLLVVVTALSVVNADADETKTEPPQHPPESRQPTSRPSRALPVTMIVIGSGAIVAGALSLPFDQDASDSPASDETFRETAVPGTVAIASGLVLAGLGTYLYWRSGRTTTTIDVNPRASGGVVSLTKQF